MSATMWGKPGGGRSKHSASLRLPGTRDRVPAAGPIPTLAFVLRADTRSC